MIPQRQISIADMFSIVLWAAMASLLVSFVIADAHFRGVQYALSIILLVAWVGMGIGKLWNEAVVGAMIGASAGLLWVLAENRMLF